MNPDNPSFRTPEEEARAKAFVRLDEENQRLRKALESCDKTLQSCAAAMKFAYEDRGDRYYLNVLNLIEVQMGWIEGSLCIHKWVGKKANSPMEPDEWVEFCDHCGAERLEGV